MSKHEHTFVVRVPLEVPLEGENTLDGQSRICNWVYNTLVDKANTLKNTYKESQDPEIGKTLYTERGLRDLLPDLKEKHPFLKVVYSFPLKNAALRVSHSIQTHQKSRKGKRKGKKTGWPRFRSWNKGWFSLLYDEPDKGYKVEGNKLILSLGMGLDKEQRRVVATLKTTTPLRGKDIRNLRIVKQLGVFFAVFTVKAPLPPSKPVVANAIALDPNHKNLAYGVATDRKGIEIAAPHWIKGADRRIGDLLARRDKCKRRSQKIPKGGSGENSSAYYWKPSRKWTQFDRMIENLRRKRREQTKTFLFTIAQALFRRYDLVAIGDYTPDGTGDSRQMRRAMNNQSLIGRFKEILSWVALKSGKHFAEFSEKGTTRTCHACHFVVEDGLKPNIREWTCPGCKACHHRDENSAVNGLRRVLRDLNLENLVPCSGLASFGERWAWRVLPSGMFAIPRGQCGNDVAAPRNSTESMIAFDQNSMNRIAHV